MLSACHGRVERQCDTLLRLLPHLSQHGADVQAHEAVLAVTRYFEVAAVHHHADEEIDLFPALLEAVAGSDAICIRELTQGLVEDHARLGACWNALSQALQERLAAGDIPGCDDGLIELTHRFVDTYRLHIEREESELLPLAQRLLDDAQLTRIGVAMRQRRGL